MCVEYSFSRSSVPFLFSCFLPCLTGFVIFYECSLLTRTFLQKHRDIDVSIENACTPHTKIPYRLKQLTVSIRDPNFHFTKQAVSSCHPTDYIHDIRFWQFPVLHWQELREPLLQNHRQRSLYPCPWTDSSLHPASVP